MNPRTSTTRPPRILGVFAHPDDETFCAGGTLAKYAAAGAEIMIVSATRGDAGQIHDALVATRRTLGQVRERELRLACERLGIRHAVCLDYGDGTLKDVAPEVLTRHITRIVRTFRPDIVITFGPDGAYGHPDHIAIGAATTSACTLAGDTAAFADQIDDGFRPHTPAAVYHSSFPRSPMLLLEFLVQWLNGQERRFRGSFDFMNALLLLAKEASVLGFTSDHVDVQWYPAGFYIVEQAEPATKLYMILSGVVEVMHEDDDGVLHKVARLEPGMFFGAEDPARQQPSDAHIVAQGSVTCLVFAPGAPTAFAGRGTNAGRDLDSTAGQPEAPHHEATTAIDVSAFVERKIAAIAAHRTQCPIAPGMLPLAMFQQILGCEYFVRVAPARELETSLLTRLPAPVIRLHDRRPVSVAA